MLASAAGALNANLFAFLFGSILTVTRADLAAIASLGIAGLALVALLYRGLVAVSLDPEGARVSGLPVTGLNVILAALAGLTVAVSMRIVGVLLIAALMVLPVMAAARFASSIFSTMLVSMGIGVSSVVLGLTLSYYADLAPGGAIVLLAGAAAAVAVVGEAFVRRS